MFGLGHAPELILVLVIALIVLGPGKIPEVAQLLGKGIRELRQASADLQKTFDVNELINPAPPPPPVPPPVEAAPAPVAAATTETILPPAEAPAKPKRTRKRAAAAGQDTTIQIADTHPPVAGSEAKSEGAEASANGSAPAKPRARRGPSKKAAEAVSLDVPV